MLYHVFKGYLHWSYGNLHLAMVKPPWPIYSKGFTYHPSGLLLTMITERRIDGEVLGFLGRQKWRKENPRFTWRIQDIWIRMDNDSNNHNISLYIHCIYTHIHIIIVYG